MSNGRDNTSKNLDAISGALDKVAENIQQAKAVLLKKLNTPLYYSAGGDFTEQRKHMDKNSSYFDSKFEAAAKTDSTNLISRLQWKESTEKHHRLELDVTNDNPAEVKKVVARVIGNNFTEVNSGKGKFLVIATNEQEKGALQKLDRRETAFEALKTPSLNQEAKKEMAKEKEADVTDHAAPPRRIR